MTMLYPEDHNYASMIVFFVDFQQNMHPVCILQYFHLAEANIQCRAHKNSKEPDSNNYVRTKPSVFMKVKKEVAGQFLWVMWQFLYLRNIILYDSI